MLAMQDEAFAPKIRIWPIALCYPNRIKPRKMFFCYIRKGKPLQQRLPLYFPVAIYPGVETIDSA